MNSKIKAAVIFVAGAAIGSVTAWYLVKDKYKQIADEEIASVKEHYSKKKEKTESKNSPDEKNEETIQEPEEDHTKEYEEILEKTKYVNYGKRALYADNKVIEETIQEDDNPFVSFINDDEYGFEFETESLDYFMGDDTVISEMGEEMSEEEIHEAIGVDWKDRFENCGYEILYIRNSYLEKDYEVVMSRDKWKDNAYSD